jgi:glycerol-3-phosphate acyltransferase PlsY
MDIRDWLLCALLGYALGAIPTGVIVARWRHGISPHRSGSTHTGGLNVYRTTQDRRAAVLTGLVDLCLGAAAVSLARTWFPGPWSGPLAGVAAVWGHNYSALIRFRGGVGMSTLLGAMAVISWPAALGGLLVLALAWFAIRRILRHDARSTIVAMLLLPVLMWATKQPPQVQALSAFGAIPVVLKELGDYHRVYRGRRG